MSSGPAGNRRFPRVIAGFECGRLEWQDNHCILTSSDHVPGGKMRDHYEIAKDHGMTVVRDGLPWWLPIEPRLQIARDAGIGVIWDLNHYWRHVDHMVYAARVADAVKSSAPNDQFWICFNELTYHPIMCPGESLDCVVRQSIEILNYLQDRIDVRLVTAEPAHDRHWLDPLANHADMIGLNIYRLHLNDRIEAIIDRASVFRKPIIISETGCTDGKAEWLDRICSEASGAESVCWYPIVNNVDWNDTERLCDHGLIREDLTLDKELSEAIKKHNGDRSK